MNKLNVCVLFGGVSPEHEVSLRSAESVLSNMNPDQYNIFPVGITKDGKWFLYGGLDYSALPNSSWLEDPENKPVALSPVRGQGLLVFENDSLHCLHIDVVFPIIHGENGEDGALQGLLQLADIPFVGPHVLASAVAMDKTITKLVADSEGVVQADWIAVSANEIGNGIELVLDRLEKSFSYPVFIKPAGTGSSVGVSKAHNRESARNALFHAAEFDNKVLIEEFIDGREVEVAVMGNSNPVASVCGEIDSGAEFYDYDAKYTTDTSVAYIPARISEETAESVRETAIAIYKAMGCQGMSRVDFFVTRDDERIIFNEINTIPGFTSISMYPKLFAASGIPYSSLIDELLQLALEACK